MRLRGKWGAGRVKYMLRVSQQKKDALLRSVTPFKGQVRICRGRSGQDRQ